MEFEPTDSPEFYYGEDGRLYKRKYELLDISDENAVPFDGFCLIHNRFAHKRCLACGGYVPRIGRFSDKFRLCQKNECQDSGFREEDLPRNKTGGRETGSDSGPYYITIAEFADQCKVTDLKVIDWLRGGWLTGKVDNRSNDFLISPDSASAFIAAGCPAGRVPKKKHRKGIDERVARMLDGDDPPSDCQIRKEEKRIRRKEGFMLLPPKP